MSGPMTSSRIAPTMVASADAERARRVHPRMSGDRPQAQGGRCDRRSVRPVHPAGHRSHNGPEFVAKAVQQWIAVVGAKTAYIERGSPWETDVIDKRFLGCRLLCCRGTRATA